MKVLLACEQFGKVRDAFIRRGHDAVSCDTEPTRTPGPHIQGDAIEAAYSEYWDLMIMFWPCTFLCNSGVRWLREKPGRWEEMRKSAEGFRKLFAAPIKLKGAENPIPHKYALDIIGRKYDQIIQPWQFGHGETKATCLWLDGLPPLMPTSIVNERRARIHRMPPGPDRGILRSETYNGIAEAMAQQWGEQQ